MNRVIIVTYKEPYIVREIRALVESLNYKIVEIITQKKLGRGKYGLGYGKVKEIKDLVKREKVDMIIYDDKLSVSKVYNLAKETQVPVVDRERLILNIFNERASTEEAKLQVKLAELRYELARAKEKVRLAKLGEQPGFYGLGKYEVDIYYRDLKRRMLNIMRKLKEVSSRRSLYRERRKDLGLKTVALSGYTGAGKSTLFNLLAKEKRETDRGVFTTLSPLTRSIWIGGKKVLLLDTVGFIDRLPTYMIEAFKSTLEELVYSNLVLLLIDLSDDEEEIVRKFNTCKGILSDLKVNGSKLLYVLNKVDLVDDLKRRLEIFKDYEPKVVISAKKGIGIETLIKEMENHLVDRGP